MVPEIRARLFAAFRSSLPWLLYLGLAFASFYPQLASPRDSVAYVGDSVESVYIVAWNVHQFFSQPWRLFDANVLYPNAHALAFTDHRLLPSLAVAPVVWASGNPVLAYNVALVLACLLAAFAARGLARTLGCDGIAAWAAGALYAFHTYQVHEASRLNVICHGFVPLALGQLVLLLKTGRRAHAWKTGVCMLLQGLCSNYHLLYGSFLVGVVSLGALLARPRLVARRLPSLLLAGVVAAALFAPIAVPYVQVSRAQGHARPLPQSMGLEHYVSTAPGNVLYGAIGGDVGAQQRGPHFVGFVSMMLAALAVATLRLRDDGSALISHRIWVPAAVGLALLLLLLSLGRNIVLSATLLAPGPYRLLYDYVPGFQLVRIPERLGLLAMLFVALLVGRGLTLLRVWRLGPLAAALALLVPLEHVSVKAAVARVPVAREVPQVYGWLARDTARAVAELPVRGESMVRDETLEMYFSAYHWKPIIHGYTAYPPVLTRLIRRLAAQFPAEASLQAFQRIGVDTVIVHHGRQVGRDLYRTISGQGEEKEERYRRLMQATGLDLYGQLPRAVAEGRIVRVARFQGDAAHLFDSTLDEVYRIQSMAPRPAAPFPGGTRTIEGAWQYRATRGDPRLAADGRLDTTWSIEEPLVGDESFEVLFDRPVSVAGVVLPVRWDTPFPTRFRIDGRIAGEWQPLARFGEAQALQLLDRLLADPSSGAMGFVLDGRELGGLRLAVEAGGTSFDGWAIPEIILEKGT